MDKILILILAMFILMLGCESFIVKIPDLKCIRCNEDGRKPEECASVTEPTFCDPQDSNIRNYKGCGTVIGKLKDGTLVTSKSCIADCNQQGVINSGYGKEPQNGECVTLDKRQSISAQQVWQQNVFRGKSYLQSYYPEITYCYCDTQACNVGGIREQPLVVHSGGGVIKLCYFLYLVPVVIAFVLVPGLDKCFLK